MHFLSRPISLVRNAKSLWTIPKDGRDYVQKLVEKKQKIQINRKLTPQCLVNVTNGQQLADFPEVCHLLLSILTKRQKDKYRIQLGKAVGQPDKYEKTNTEFS